MQLQFHQTCAKYMQIRGMITLSVHSTCWRPVTRV